MVPACQRPGCPTPGRYAVLDTDSGDVVIACGAHMTWLADSYDIGCRYLVSEVVVTRADTGP